MARSALIGLTLLVAVFASVYQLWFKPILEKLGHGREIRPVGDPTQCKNIPALKACEKLVLHQASGLVYLACSTLESRPHWVPAVGRLNGTGMSNEDYLAIYDPDTDKITRMNVVNFNSDRGLSLHGMDVVPSSSDPSLLYVYLVNHRKPLQGDAKKVGADSVIEVFETTVGGPILKHIKTVDDPLVVTPNDIVGYGDGKSFHFTNDHGSKTGFLRELELLGLPRTSVGYCHLDDGCKLAVSGMHANNGIASSRINSTMYVANSGAGGITVLERQLDNTLVITDVVPTEYLIDNLTVDEDGNVWAAGFPNAIQTALKHFEDPSLLAPVAAFRMSINTGPDGFYGRKYRVDRVFENDGSVVSGSTTVAHDSKRNRLYFTGLASPSLTICTL